MLISGIPSTQIITKIARRNKDYELEFINTDSNSDLYTLKIFLRKYDQDEKVCYKIRLLLASNILAAPAFEAIWVFEEDEYDLASRVYHRICDEVDYVKTDFDKSMAPVSTLAAQIREAVKPISISHQEVHHILPLDEANRQAGVSDWRGSLYSGHYPNISMQEKHRIRIFDGNTSETPLNRKSYGLREKY